MDKLARISTEERQVLIVDEAIKIIHEMGYQSFSIRELSTRVGISEPAIYRHFLNKEDIVLGILARFSEFDIKLFNEVKLICKFREFGGHDPELKSKFRSCPQNSLRFSQYAMLFECNFRRLNSYVF